MGKKCTKLKDLQVNLLKYKEVKNYLMQVNPLQFISIVPFCFLLLGAAKNCTSLPFPTDSSSSNCWAPEARQLCVFAATERAKIH